MRMTRKQVYIEPRHQELLQRRARELGVSQAELIRLGIDRLGELVAGPADEEAWQQELDFVRRRARRLKGCGERRRWTREELYEERLERVPR